MCFLCSSARRFAFELSAAGAGELVVLRAPVVLRDAPRGFDVALLLQLQERRVERAVVDQEPLAARLLDAPGDAVPVSRPQGLERFQNHQGERALPDVLFITHDLLH